MAGEVVVKDADRLMPQIMESVMLVGDLQKLTPQQRVQYYGHVCESMGLNPLTKPFDYISLNGKLTLYATKNCTDQLRHRDNISIRITGRELLGDIYVVTAAASTPSGRVDESTGAMPIANLKGEALANAYMKCETKAKRRATLSICGMGLLDEMEVDSVPGSRFVNVDQQGQIAAPEPKQETASKPEPKPEIPEGVKVLWDEMKKGKSAALGVFQKLKDTYYTAFGEQDGDLKYREALAEYIPQTDWNVEEKRPEATGFTDGKTGSKAERYNKMTACVRKMFEDLEAEAQRRAAERIASAVADPEGDPATWGAE